MSNSLPLLVVGTGILYFYGSIAKQVIVMIWLFTGFWVWLAARPESHIGASGLIYGFVVFIFQWFATERYPINGHFNARDFSLWKHGLGILPVDQSISFESHFFGSVAGLIAAVYYRKEGPQRPKSQWEIDEENGIATEPEYGPFENSASESQTDNPPLKITYEYIEKQKNTEGEPESGTK